MKKISHLNFTISLGLDFVANSGVETTRFSILGPWKYRTLLLSSTSWTPLCMSHSFNLAWGFLSRLMFYIWRVSQMKTLNMLRVSF